MSILSRITPAHIRAARALLGMKQEEFANLCELSTNSLQLIESGRTIPRASTLERIEQKAASVGIRFIWEAGKTQVTSGGLD